LFALLFAGLFFFHGSTSAAMSIVNVSGTPVATLTSITLTEKAPKTPSLRDLLGDPNCKRACWQGIEPGVTNLATLKEIWKEYDLIPEMVVGLGDDANNAIYTWTIDPQMPFITREKKVNVVLVTVHKGMVIQMIVPLNPCISQVTTEYGEPSGVAVNKAEHTFDLLYPEQGMVVYINAQPGTFAGRVNNVFLVSEASFSPFSEDSPARSIVQWSEVVGDLSMQCLM
jgi:hypothetical protein